MANGYDNNYEEPQERRPKITAESLDELGPELGREISTEFDAVNAQFLLNMILNGWTFTKNGDDLSWTFLYEGSTISEAYDAWVERHSAA